MEDFLERLQKATENCREDMHESDEQEISAVVSGLYLDNAFGSDPRNNQCELTVGIIKTDNMDAGYADMVLSGNWFNLATLIALARKVVLTATEPSAPPRKKYADINGRMWQATYPLCAGCPDYVINGYCGYEGNGCRFPKERIKKPINLASAFIVYANKHEKNLSEICIELGPCSETS